MLYSTVILTCVDDIILCLLNIYKNMYSLNELNMSLVSSMMLSFKFD